MYYKSILLSCMFTLIFAGCEPLCSISSTDIEKMYASYVETWHSDVKQSFNEAEKEVIDAKPIPKPDDIPKIDPDPAKCICKGSGIIVHGDGHKTVCEYHGKSLKGIKK